MNGGSQKQLLQSAQQQNDRSPRAAYNFGIRPARLLQPPRSKTPIELDLMFDDDDQMYEKNKRFDDYGHMRFGKRGVDQFDDYGHMRFGRSSDK